MAESDAERAATDAKNEFVARVSHELRTPINTILGFGELLCLADLTAEHHDWAATMVRAARQLGSVLDDLLDLSRAETRKLSLSREPVDVAGVLADAVEIIRPLSASHGVYIDPLPPVSAHVLADQQRLRQVLLNLLSNAVKYNHPTGRVTIAVAEAPGGRLRISIADTGRGIADYDIAQLFTPFQRLDAAEAGIEGAGLGLTLSRQLIEAMDGTLSAISAPGEGSVFSVDLPVTEPATAAPPAAADQSLASRAYGGPRTVLYIEDMVVTLRLVEHILNRRPSITVVPAMLGGVALELAAEHRPDLILLDLNLPDMPGEEILRRLKADPATAATPVIILSGDTAPDRIDDVLAAGATAYLTKPLSVQRFLHTIDAILAQPGSAQAEPGTGEAEQATGQAEQATGQAEPATAEAAPATGQAAPATGEAGAPLAGPPLADAPLADDPDL